VIEQWVKPVYQEVSVSGECTAYAGANQDTTQSGSAVAVRPIASPSGGEETAAEEIQQ
jgi:hypothetical protein